MSYSKSVIKKGDLKMCYGAKIKNYLDENGIKYVTVANKLNISSNILSTMLNGKRKITVEEYFNICKILNVSVNYFMDTTA